MMCYSRDMIYTLEFMQQIQAEVLEYLGRAELAADDSTGRDEAMLCLVLAAVIWRQTGDGVRAVRALSVLAEAVDDETVESLLSAVMLPLQRFGYRKFLAGAEMHLAGVNGRRGKLEFARIGAKSALHHFEDMKDARGKSRAREFLEVINIA